MSKEVKYELTDETIDHYGTILHRIRALRDIERFGVKKGDLGGYVQSEKNLDQEGDCWVSDTAQVSGMARVSGEAGVYGAAWISDEARVLGMTRISDKAWISGEARVYGKAWVSGEARVFGEARVSGEARVEGGARVFGEAWISEPRHVLTIGPIGSENVTITLARSEDEAGHILNVGCWTGTVPELMAEVKRRRKSWNGVDTERSGYLKDEYKAVKALCELRIASWG